MKKITKFEVDIAPVYSRHKYEAHFVFEDGSKKKTRFGAKGYDDYTMHRDKERRERYWQRHVKDLSTGDPTRAGYLSLYILWGGNSNLYRSIAEYKRRLHEYNKTGKFPTEL